MKIAIGAAAAILGLLYVGIASQSNQSGEPEKRTELISSTSKTEGSKATETTDRDDVKTKKKESSSSGDASAQTSAKLLDFKLDTFKATKGTRVLLFHNPASASSKKTYVFIKENLARFSGRTTFFSLDYNKNKELVEHYNVEQAGTLIAFNTEGEITGIYVSEDPNIEAAKTALGV